LVDDDIVQVGFKSSADELLLFSWKSLCNELQQEKDNIMKILSFHNELTQWAKSLKKQSAGVYF